MLKLLRRVKSDRKLMINLLSVFVLAILIGGQIVMVSAQTATPVPTSVPTTIEVPTGVIFDEANSWITTFAPIAAIGIGITIAIAVLGYIGKMIAQAFH